jgi:two-component system, NarL family, sensor histidine kinase DevS
VTTPEEPLVELLRRVVSRAEDVVAGEERVRALLDAVVAVGGSLDLHETLQRIVVAAARLAEARYAALGVLDPVGEQLADFITYGVSDEERASIGALPRGHGILGLLITDPRPLRLHNLREHPESFGFPDGHPTMSSFLGVPVRVRDRVFGNLYLTEKGGGGDFTIEDEQAMRALATTAGIAVENARLFEETQRRARWATATAEIQRALLGHVDRGAALALVAARAREVAAADISLVVLEQDDGNLRVEAVDGPRPDLQAAALPRQGALADVVDRGATVHLGGGVRVPGVDDLASALLVPFTGPGGAGGALLVGATASRSGRWASDSDVEELRGFAAQAALALDRAQAQDDRAALAVLADRDRIARDLHDIVIQRLFATGLSLQGAARLAARPEVAERLTDAIDDLDMTIRDIRGTIFELGRDEATDDLRGQVHDIVAAAEPTLGSKPMLSLEGPLDSALSPAVRPHLLAVLAEALSNAARHAGASRVEVRVAVEESPAASVVVEVSDDGKGFSASGHESGLRNMRERAAEVRGTCEVSSRPGEGTKVRWRAPLQIRPPESS